MRTGPPFVDLAMPEVRPPGGGHGRVRGADRRRSGDLVADDQDRRSGPDPTRMAQRSSDRDVDAMGHRRLGCGWSSIDPPSAWQPGWIRLPARSRVGLASGSARSRRHGFGPRVFAPRSGSIVRRRHRSPQVPSGSSVALTTGPRPASARRAGRLPGMARYTYGGQALIEGVLMRGRDAIAVAFRHPDGQIVWETERLDAGFHGSRWSKMPFVRGLVVLYETLVVGHALARPVGLAGGLRGGRGARPGRGRAHARGHPGCRGRDLLPAAPAHRHVHHEPDRERVRPAPGRGPRPGRDLPRLPRAHRPGRRREAGLPVPRRRAHDDPRARSRRPADHDGGAQVPDRPPALRDRVPGRRDRPVDHHVQPRRAAVAGRHGGQPDPAHPGDRRDRLRAPPARRAASGQPDRPHRHDARDLGPEDHDPPADRRHDRGRDRLDGAGAERRRRGRSRREAPRSPASRWPTPRRASRRSSSPTGRGCPWRSPRCRAPARRRRPPAEAERESPGSGS